MKGRMLLLAALALGGCQGDGDYDPTVPTSMELVAGSGQSGEPGEVLGVPFTVRVLNLEGDPVAGVEVEWFNVSGNGSLSAATTLTDENGIASVTYTVGPLVGEQRSQAVRSNLAGSPINFSVTGRPGDGGGDGGGDGET